MRTDSTGYTCTDDGCECQGLPESLLTRIRRIALQPGRPTIPEVQPLVAEFYALPDHGAGGVLHIVLDDNNVSDADVRFCIGEAVAEGDEVGEVLGRVLLRMSKTQRLKVARGGGR